MARSSYKTFLMHKPAEGDSYTKLIDIKDYPALGGPPEMLPITTLSQRMETSIPGIQSLDAMEYTANYDAKDYARLKALEGETIDFAVWMGGTENLDGTVTPTGEEGAFSFKGALSVFVAGAGVNEVSDMKISIAVSTVITFSETPTT